MLTVQKLLPTALLALALAVLALSLNPFAANAAAASTASQKAPYHTLSNAANQVAGNPQSSPSDNQGEPQYSDNSKGRPGQNAPIQTA